MKEILMSVFYMPPVSWFNVFLDENSEVIFEQFENFPKQTFRNRANIYGANGKLPLIIPIKHNGERSMNRIEISYAEDWKNLHWKSIKTAYQSSPYFEFYEDRLRTIFDFESPLLFDFNLNALKILQQILKTEKAYSLNSEYAKLPEGEDYRSKFSAKETPAAAEEYYQVFSDRYGFLADLSVLDVICNLGPESFDYIKKFKS